MTHRWFFIGSAILTGVSCCAPVARGDEPGHADYWSYRPVERPATPSVGTSAHSFDSHRSIANPIDAFIETERDKRGLHGSPAADPAVLLRRVYLDLIGFPPTRDELHAFLVDPSQANYERIVERLLSSPQYGERWGRHWMDVWRYSDWYGSRGINEIRYSQRHIWRWRDWIIDSLNADKGYDRMIREMLAGDELAPSDPDVARATGFIGRNWYKFDRNVWMFDAVEHTAQAFLGLTLRCARCHDHKYDPISQQDYYRFRAFFEPHDVRTDPVSDSLGTEKDATLGPVLTVGLARVYDKQLDAPTYVFARGDNRFPETQLMEPSVPGAFGMPNGEIRPIPLPIQSVAPWLSDATLNSKRRAADAEVQAAETAAERVQSAVAHAERDLAEWLGRESSGAPYPAPAKGAVFADRFESSRPDVWRTARGRWAYENGRVSQSDTGTFSTMVATQPHPTDFTARVRYRTNEAGAIHSVGFFFDAVELRDGQGVYTAANKNPTVQAFHRQAGQEHYPAEGIKAHPIAIGQEITLDVAARGQLLNVWVNGDLVLAYTMPMARQSGTIAIWTHSGTADFYEVLIDALPPEQQLAQTVAEHIRSPYAAPTQYELERTLKIAQRSQIAAAQAQDLAQATRATLEARIAADRAQACDSPDAASFATQAADRERSLKLRQAEHGVSLAENELFSANLSLPRARVSDEAALQKMVASARSKVDSARKVLDAVRADAAKQDPTTYTPIGPIYPKTSTGRRLALADWIADARNPRTARIAVNHIWLRHFGQAIVPTVANFGKNGSAPSHPELLDWLAAELVEHAWSMKHLHRLIVLSNTYRQSSTESDYNAATTAGGSDASGAVATPLDPQSIDPENRFLWRMNSRRMESEAVRDSILWASGQLDLAQGGPEISESLGQDSTRRSVYFRSTPNEKMSLLEVFDQANPNECYRRQESVMPQQSLALSNSALCLSQSRRLARMLSAEVGSDDTTVCDGAFISVAFEQILSRKPASREIEACQRFLARDTALIRDGMAKSPFAAATGPAAVASSPDPHMRARENLTHVLFNHNDFVTVR
jgi:hypothetical protein